MKYCFLKCGDRQPLLIIFFVSPLGSIPVVPAPRYLAKLVSLSLSLSLSLELGLPCFHSHTHPRLKELKLLLSSSFFSVDTGKKGAYPLVCANFRNRCPNKFPYPVHSYVVVLCVTFFFFLPPTLFSTAHMLQSCCLGCHSCVQALLAVNIHKLFDSELHVLFIEHHRPPTPYPPPPPPVSVSISPSCLPILLASQILH